MRIHYYFIIVFLIFLESCDKEKGFPQEGAITSAIIFQDSISFERFQQIKSKLKGVEIQFLNNSNLSLGNSNDEFPSIYTKKFIRFNLNLDLTNDHVVYYFKGVELDSLEVHYTLNIKDESNKYQVFYENLKIGKHSFSKAEIQTIDFNNSSYSSLNRSNSTYDNLENVFIRITY